MTATNGNQPAPLLEVRDLVTHFITRHGVAKAVDGVSFTLERGQTLGLVGESGSGKSVTLMSIVRLVPKPAGRILDGEILLEGRDLLKLSEREMRDVRGRKISVVTQDPMSSLNPVYTIGNQLCEPLRQHQQIRDRTTLRDKVVSTLQKVGIPSPESRVRNYPHQFSGGQRQRVVTAMAIECQPSVLIADEPTTALDVTIQLQILRLLREVQREMNSGMIIVSHDLAVMARVCDDIAVMYAGRIVEKASLVDIFDHPVHPYTQALIKGTKAEVDESGRLYAIQGQSPDVRHLVPGCAFAPRCPEAMDTCGSAYPPETVLDSGHVVSCWTAVRKRDPASASLAEATE
jgi:oligopeptide/dipeptide ABC transporter ATP-binding protein